MKLIEQTGIQGRWGIRIYDSQGNLKHEDEWENRVVNAGLDYLLSAGLVGGTQITDWYIGLTGSSPTAAAADTLASHAGWTEVSAYSGDRKAWADGGVSGQSVSNSGSAASFTINANGTTIGGAFLASAATGTSGTLYAIGAFTGGDKTIGDGDTLQVTAQFDMAAA